MSKRWAALVFAAMLLGWLLATQWTVRICCNECTVATRQVERCAADHCYNVSTYAARLGGQEIAIRATERYAAQCWYLCDRPHVFGVTARCVPHESLGFGGVLIMLAAGLAALLMAP